MLTGAVAGMAYAALLALAWRYGSRGLELAAIATGLAAGFWAGLDRPYDLGHWTVAALALAAALGLWTAHLRRG